MTVDDIMKFQPAWTLAAVVVGFMLGEGSGCLRERFRIRRLKRTIRNELKSIKQQIPQKKDIVSQIIRNLERKTLLPGRSVPIISVGYGDMIKDVYEHLCPLQRNCLHVIYERLRVADDVLGRFTDDFLRAVKEQVLADPWKGFADQFHDINASYDAVSNLIDSYLSGSPIDVFASVPPDGKNTG